MTDKLSTMLAAHPQPPPRTLGVLAATLHRLAVCEQICRICADACLGEAEPAKMRECIRLDLECADACSATARVFLQPHAVGPAARQAQLHACIEYCQACADHCSQHAHLVHCRLCAESCRECQESCNRLLGAISSAGTAE